MSTFSIVKFKEYDKLYVDNKIYEWNEVLGQVVEHTENQRYGSDMMFSRPGTQLGGIFGGSGPFGGQGYANSRPPSGMSMRLVLHFATLRHVLVSALFKIKWSSGSAGDSD